MLVTLSGITISVKEAQYWNAELPMAVICTPFSVSGISILDSVSPYAVKPVMVSPVPFTVNTESQSMEGVGETLTLGATEGTMLGAVLVLGVGVTLAEVLTLGVVVGLGLELPPHAVAVKHSAVTDNNNTSNFATFFIIFSSNRELKSN